MPQLGNTLAELFKRAGVDENNAAIKVILQNDAIFKAEIPQDIVTQLEGNLMNETIALGKIKAKAKAEILDGVDTHAERILTELGLGDEVTAAFKGGKSTEQKIEAALRAISKVTAAKIEEAGKKTGKTPEDQQKLIDELNTLKAERANRDKAHQDELKRKDDEYAQKDLKTALRFEAMKYADRLNMPEEVSVEERVDIIMSRINTGISEGKYKVSIVDGRLKLTTEDGSDAYDSQNRKLDLNALAEQRLAPVLKKADDKKDTNLLGVKIPGEANAADLAYQQQLLQIAKEQGVILPS